MHTMDNQPTAADALLERALESIHNHNISAAESELEQAVSADYENESVLSSLKCVKFWSERDSYLRSIGHEFERGEYLLSQWPMFDEFAERFEAYQPCVQALRHYVFSTALASFEKLFKETDNGDPELLVRIGRCHKGLGSYDQAVRYLEAAAAERPDSAELTAELADGYALINEVAAAKAFFREAFFLDPQRVHLEVLESQMVRALARKIEDLEFHGEELREWIPVFGVLYGVFNVKRELRSIEYGKLKQSIYALERELKEGRSRRELIEPRLINHYFWLIDHYVCSGEDAAKIDEVLLKLRSLNDKIYRMYTN